MRKLVLAASLATLAGCANGQHNDVLLFGTDTKVAFDVSTNATNGGAPELTLGFKRREAVWMPLVVNGAGSAVIARAVAAINEEMDGCRAKASTPAASAQCFKNAAAEMDALGSAFSPNAIEASKYQGSTTGVKAADGTIRSEKDTYSVFASFGGDFSGSSGGRAALAQFFATGIAAQRLGENKRIDAALSVQSGEAEKARILKDALDAEREKNITAGAVAIEPMALKNAAKIDLIVVCLAGAPNTGPRTAAIATLTASSDAAVASAVKTFPGDLSDAQNFRALLRSSDVVRDAFYQTAEVSSCVKGA